MDLMDCLRSCLLRSRVKHRIPIHRLASKVGWFVASSLIIFQILIQGLCSSTTVSLNRLLDIFLGQGRFQLTRYLTAFLRRLTDPLTRNHEEQVAACRFLQIRRPYHLIFRPQQVVKFCWIAPCLQFVHQTGREAFFLPRCLTRNLPQSLVGVSQYPHRKSKNHGLPSSPSKRLTTVGILFVLPLHQLAERLMYSTDTVRLQRRRKIDQPISPRKTLLFRLARSGHRSTASMIFSRKA